jgi:hypothetical protein
MAFKCALLDKAVLSPWYPNRAENTRVRAHGRSFWIDPSLATRRNRNLCRGQLASVFCRRFPAYRHVRPRSGRNPSPIGRGTQNRRRCTGGPSQLLQRFRPEAGAPGPRDTKTPLRYSFRRPAILNASGKLGSYLPVSIALMVPRATPTRAASSACDHSISARNTCSRVFIGTATNTE